MKKFSPLFLAASILLSLSSCLKDKNVENMDYGMAGADAAKLAELASDDGSHVKSFAFPFENVPLTVAIVEVRLTSRDVPKNDVTVTVSLANSATIINTYNAANGTAVVALPTAFYTLASPLAVVIPAGQRVGYVKINTNAINYDPSATYGLGFTITSISDPAYTISGNFKTLLATFGAKNDYDGLYEITGTLVDAQGLYTGDYGDPLFPREYELITTGGQTGLFYDRSWDYPNYIVVSIATGGGANTGIRPRITFDPTTQAVASVVNANTASTANIVPVAGSRFNASDHSIDFEWFGSNNRWHTTEHWKYLGPR